MQVLFNSTAPYWSQYALLGNSCCEHSSSLLLFQCFRNPMQFFCTTACYIHIAVLICSALAHQAAYSFTDTLCVATASSKQTARALWESLQALRLCLYQDFSVLRSCRWLEWVTAQKLHFLRNLRHISICSLLE